MPSTIARCGSCAKDNLQQSPIALPLLTHRSEYPDVHYIHWSPIRAAWKHQARYLNRIKLDFIAAVIGRRALIQPIRYPLSGCIDVLWISVLMPS